MDLYDSRLSGNGWKVRLMLSRLGLPFKRHILNLAEGQARTPQFLALNPLARVPVLVTDEGTAVVESNVILMHLARGTPFLPAEGEAHLRVMQWLFFEQFDHLRYMARPRFLVSIAKVADQHADELDYLRGFGRKALQAMEDRLATSEYFAGGQATIADISLYPYTSMAEMGGYSLEPFPAIRAWIARMEAQPGHIPLLSGN
jgi:glutathione S-transferase